MLLELGSETGSDAGAKAEALRLAKRSGLTAASDEQLVARWVGARSAELFGTWLEVWGRAAERVRGVLAAGNETYTQELLEHSELMATAKVRAVSGHLGPSRDLVADVTRFDGLEVAEVLEELRIGSVLGSGASLVDLAADYAQAAEWATQGGLQLVEASGGNRMRLSGAAPEVVARYYEVFAQPEFAALQLGNLENFQAVGG